MKSIALNEINIIYIIAIIIHTCRNGAFLIESFLSGYMALHAKTFVDFVARRVTQWNIQCHI